jgi:hypothetical protein
LFRYLQHNLRFPTSVKKVNTSFKNVWWTNAKYNQVDPDQSQEWLNATGKKGGGIVGITRTPTAQSF